MSNLLVQTIKHTNNTSAQTIDSSGRTTAVLNNDTTYRSDGGAVTQNMVQGLTKVWALATMNGNTIYDSFNLSSIGDDGTGQIGFNFTNNMAGQTYAAHSNTQVGDCSGFNSSGQTSIETDEVTFQARDTSGNDFDSNPHAMSLNGDLA